MTREKRNLIHISEGERTPVYWGQFAVVTDDGRAEVRGGNAIVLPGGKAEIFQGHADVLRGGKAYAHEGGHVIVHPGGDAAGPGTIEWVKEND